MNKLIKSTIAIFCISVFLFSKAVFAQSRGYVSFENLASTYGEPKVEINLNALMMGFVGTLAKNEDPEVSSLLSQLESIRVRVYDTKGDSKKALQSIDKVTQKIRKDKWEPIVSVNEDDERVKIFAKYTDKKMDGLVVMVVSDDSHTGDRGGEVVFINIVGEIDPANIQKVTNSLNINVGS
ncbi:DUF4252 domain-containing protein [Agarilytica rhodophyticola]|uniref:DUF4252 domain-containing protein n=1 Tax=Agarilytica rhodophyticola TaxID=1737490 RepID=UPI000B3446FC|nr:DUF4252 domain-containing protein [Agarilytica rhodophyticola]